MLTLIICLIRISGYQLQMPLIFRLGEINELSCSKCRLVDVFKNMDSMVGRGAINKCKPLISLVQDEDFEALED